MLNYISVSVQGEITEENQGMYLERLSIHCYIVVVLPTKRVYIHIFAFCNDPQTQRFAVLHILVDASL